MTNFDGKAHFFLKIPYCGTFVVEIPSNSSSICMWAYGGEICFSPSASKNFPSIVPHTIPKGRGHGFNDSIYL